MIKKKVTAGSRIGAMLLDHIVMTFIIMFLVLPFTIGSFDGITDESTTTPFSSGLVLYAMIFGMSLYLNKDMIQGKSVAKRALKQEVVDIKTGEVASSLKCLVRNLTIAVWPIEVIAVLISPSQRIGDFIAGTRVEYKTDERNSKPKIDFKNLLLSILLGFMIIYLGSFLIKGKIGNGAFDSPDYVETSYNKTLSTQIEIHLDSARSDYLADTHIKVYDTISNDSLKYITALLYLNENYIDRSSFDGIKQEIFNSMYQIVPKSDFILMGKFIYDGQSTKKSTWRTYDWRKIDK
ncbi:MAG: RDD family protein [Bacteroidetes bacterium]|nr:RDD family protein [Bacteroidota bacterium]